MKQIGRVRAVFRYPVKSMAGEQVERAMLGLNGVEGDRRLAFLRDTSASGFPWLTAGKLPSLVRYRPVRDGAGDPAALPTHVEAPDGEVLDLWGDSLREAISRAFGEPVRLVRVDRGIFDEASVSVIAASTVDEIARLAGVPSDVRRFRPNVLVETAEGRPFEEDDWVGSMLSFGSASGAAVAAVSRDVRCAMINLHPESGETSPEVLKAVVHANDNNAGIYAAAVRAGAIAVGDPVFLGPLA
jgi:uncharacterized protein YcbX